jgi:hypothetical protein
VRPDTVSYNEQTDRLGLALNADDELRLVSRGTRSGHRTGKYKVRPLCSAVVR